MKIVTSLVVCAAIAAISSCSTVTLDTDTVVRAEQGVPGGEVVRTTSLDARVSGIDATTRDIGLVSRHGEAFTVHAGPGVRNFNQIHIGDYVNVSLQERLLVRMAKPGEKLNDEAWVSARGAARGAKPGAKAYGKEQYVGTVTAIDAKRRKATLRFSDGSSGKFDVRPDIDLSKHGIGEKVLIRRTESLAVSVRKS